MFECGNVRNSTFEQSVYTSISFHPLTFATSEDPDEMQHNADFIWVCTDCLNKTEIYLKKYLICDY